MLNAFGVRIVAFLNDVSVRWHVLGVGVFLGFAAAWWGASARHWFMNPEHERTRAREAARTAGARWKR